MQIKVDNGVVNAYNQGQLNANMKEKRCTFHMDIACSMSFTIFISSMSFIYEPNELLKYLL